MKNSIVMYVLLLILVFPSAVIAQSSESKVIIISLVNQDPDPAIAGDIVEIRLGVENRGGVAAENLILEIMPEYPFTMVSGEPNIQEVGTIKAYQIESDMKIVKFKLKVDRDATAGEYELKVKEYEEGQKGVSIERSVSIEVKSKESAEVIYINRTTLIPGKQSGIKFIINNVGNAPLRDLRFYWENDDKIILPVGSDNTKYIKYIDIGDSAELDYQVIADTNAEPGLYGLDLHLAYGDPITGKEKNITTLAGVYVGGETDFDIAFSESSAGETSFSIANIGSNPAYSVSVIIPKQNGWIVSGSNSMIIGNLNKGDYTVASFTLQSMQARTVGSQVNLTAQRESMQAQSTVKIQIAYTDTRGQRNLVEKEVSVNPQLATGVSTAGTMPTTFGRARSQQQSFFAKYMWYIIIVALLVLVFVSHRKYKKHKLSDPNFKWINLFRKKKK